MEIKLYYSSYYFFSVNESRIESKSGGGVVGCGVLTE